MKARAQKPRFIYSLVNHDQKVVYVGLSVNVKSRFTQHMRQHKELIKIHKSHGLSIESSKTPYSESVAGEKEREKIREWNGLGYRLLNIAPGGSLGGDVLKWDKPACLIDAKRFQTRMDWQLNSPSAYHSARKNAWLGECCSHMPEYGTDDMPKKLNCPLVEAAHLFKLQKLMRADPASFETMLKIVLEVKRREENPDHHENFNPPL